MERPKQVKTIEEAYSKLSLLHHEVTRGAIPTPGEMVSHVREFKSGVKFRISRPLSNRFYVRIIEKDGTNRGFGISADGLTDISFTDDKRYQDIRASDLDDESMIRFKLAAKELTPWFFERYENAKPKPLPKKVQSLFRKLGVTIK